MGNVERTETRTGKPSVFLRAQIVKDNDNTYTLFLGNVVSPIPFKRGEHRAFERLESLFAEATKGQECGGLQLSLD